MKKERFSGWVRGLLLLAALLCGLTGFFYHSIPEEIAQICLPVLSAVVIFLTFFWVKMQSRRISDFSNDICETLDAFMEEREPDNFRPYEDSEVSRVQGKLLQYYGKMKDGRQQSAEDKKIIQELVSDISHQVKTPAANLRLYMGILQQHSLSEEKRKEFLNRMEGQVDKLAFLMESLVKMSRLETGTFVLYIEEKRLCETIAEAVGCVWAKAEQKNIRIEADCDSRVILRHDKKWTAEALANILDNAVKYTPAGGAVTISVRPWQFYTRIDIADTGMGISAKHYNDVFKRFYRAPEAAEKEGVGLGLYLASGIITRQKGYISVKSDPGKGTVFSVYMLNKE